MSYNTHKRSYKRHVNGVDRRKAYYIVLDTETCNSFLNEDGSLNTDYSLVYDLGFAVVDKLGRVYEEHSFVIYEVFFAMQDVMQSAYYADKIENYLDDIEAGLRKVVTFNTARRTLWNACHKYNVKAIMAHNARFDYKANKVTNTYLTKSAYRYFYPRGVELWDTLKMARDTFGKEPSYRRWCAERGYMTNHKTPQVRLTAEILYRYITGDDNFIESHTGLEDVMIEKEIFKACMAKHKPMRKKLFEA